MERYTMFSDCKNQYCENDYTTLSNLQIQCNPINIPRAFFTELKINNPKICMETQKTPNRQSNLEKKKE